MLAFLILDRCWGWGHCWCNILEGAHYVSFFLMEGGGGLLGFKKERQMDSTRETLRLLSQGENKQLIHGHMIWSLKFWVKVHSHTDINLWSFFEKFSSEKDVMELTIFEDCWGLSNLVRVGKWVSASCPTQPPFWCCVFQPPHPF